MIQSKTIEKKLSNLFEKWSGIKPSSIKMLPLSGSKRIYYRLKKHNQSAIGVYNQNQKENVAFIDFTKQLKQSRLNVPDIYAEELIQNIYLIQDLGDDQLLTKLLVQRETSYFPPEAIKIYQEIIDHLIRFQVIAGRNFDYSSCHQHPEFNRESILFDLNYFKKNFVEVQEFKYTSEKLISEYELFTSYLLTAESKYFMYRDFQARNIMIFENEPYFIDYQGARKGPLQYDLVSLLFQAKAQIPEKIKDQLLHYYMKQVRLFTPICNEEFTAFYFAFALIRVFQTLGAYGLRGLVENKKHFIESIPLAINNLHYLSNKTAILKQMPETKNLIDQIIQKA